MSADGVLSAKKLLAIRQRTGIEAIRGWAVHPYWEFRDEGDRHYRLNTQTGEWHSVEQPMHYSSCPSVRRA